MPIKHKIRSAKGTKIVELTRKRAIQSHHLIGERNLFSQGHKLLITSLFLSPEPFLEGVKGKSSLQKQKKQTFIVD